MVIFSIFFGGVRGIFSLGMVDPSPFGWRLVPGRSFRVSFPCFDGGVYFILFG